MESILDCSASINPLGPSPRAVEAIENSISLISHYPEPGADRLKKELAGYLGVDPAQVVLGNGGSELIYLLARMFYKERILLLAPCFSEYGKGILNPRIEHFLLDAEQAYKLPWESFCSGIAQNDLIFIGNPNNPTGNLFERSALIEVAKQAAQKQATVIIDEAFLDFAGDSQQSLRDRILENENLIIVSSLTKFFAIPGLRLGYAIAPPKTASTMEKLLPCWRINLLASAAAIASLTDRTYIEKTVRTVQKEREFIERELSGLGFTVYPGVSNFLLVLAPTDKGASAREIQRQLGPRGILIRICDNFVNLSPYHFRIAVKTRPENLRLLEALKGVYA